MSKHTQRKKKDRIIRDVNVAANEAVLAREWVPFDLATLVRAAIQSDCLHTVVMDYSQAIQRRYSEIDAVGFAWLRSKPFIDKRGTTGVVGPRGVQGAQGYQGVQGPQGSQGVIGIVHVYSGKQPPTP